MYKHLFSPFKIKNLEIKNRCVASPMVTNFCSSDGNATDRYISYHEEKAKGGWGLIITEDYAVVPDGRGFRDLPGLWEDSQIASHTRLAETVHKHGARIISQIYHCGRQTNVGVTGQPVRAPSAIPCPFSPDMPVPLTTEETWNLVERFGDTALRAKKAGFDGVEVHGAHGYLVAEFLSPYSNKRSDEFGGSPQRRMRFAVEIVKNIRKKCGSDFVIDFRISGDEFIDGGRTMADTDLIIPALMDAGIDMAHLTAGVYASLWAVIPPSYVPHAWIARFAAEIKRNYGLPVITVGRINDPGIADNQIAIGNADLVAMGRASLVDPHMPEKAKAGKISEIRHCIGCNAGCVGYLLRDLPITCVLNPELGHEYETKPDKPARSLNLVIVGAGPAGMEAGIYAARAGHKVTILEKNTIPGGQFFLAAVPPCKGTIADFTAWQMEELKKLGVTPQFGVEATVEKIAALKPDMALVATGSEPVIPRIPGVDQAHVVTAHDVLAGKKNVKGERMVVIGGGEVGAEMAHYLGTQLKKVVMVEMLPEIIPDMVWTNRYMLMKALEKWHVKIHTSSSVTEIGESSVKMTTPEGDIEVPADSVVIAVGAKSRKELFANLQNAGIPAQLIGDANSPGQIQAALNVARKAVFNLV